LKHHFFVVEMVEMVDWVDEVYQVDENELARG
jgi:hypothetical protein